MIGYSKCPNCEKEKVIVSLRRDGDSMICPLSESVY